MGDKIQEKKSFIDYLDESIRTIERRQGYLKAKLVFETDEKVKEEINEELTTLDQQMAFAIDARNNIDREMNKAKDEKQKKYIENMLKASYFIGMMRENIRINTERDMKFDKEYEEFQEIMFERAVETAFATMELRHVTRDMVEQIMNDTEFEDMENTQDYHRLDRQADDMRATYESAIDSLLRLNSNEDLNADFEVKQRRMSVIQNKKNGFYAAEKEVREMLNSDYFKKFATEEDKEFYEQIYTQILEVGKETTMLYRDFEKNESNFEKGNGFSRVLINKEEEIVDKVKKHAQEKLLPRVLELADNNDENVDDVNKIYAASLHFIHPMAIQSGIDKVLCETNELRTRMEMWKVRERLPKGGSLTKRQKQKAVDDEYKCWAKVERIKRMGAQAGGLDRSVSEWAAENALNAFKKAKDIRDSERDANIAKSKKKKFSDEDRQNIKRQLAGLVLKHLISIESRKKDGKYKGHYLELVDYKSKNKRDTYEQALKEKFNKMAKDLSEDPDFLKSYEKLVKGKDVTTKIINFIAEDLDMKLAKELDEKFSKDFEKGKITQLEEREMDNALKKAKETDKSKEISKEKSKDKSNEKKEASRSKESVKDMGPQVLKPIKP